MLPLRNRLPLLCMWEQYRKRFVLTQLFILSLSAVLKFYVKADWLNTIAAFVVMQFGAVIGAWWGARLSRKIEAKRDQLPLHRR